MNTNRPIPCPELAPLLSELVDGTLPREEAMRVRAHLDGCAECRQLLADLRHLRADLDRLPRLNPPPSLAGRVRAQARRDGLLGARPASVGQRLLPTLPAAKPSPARKSVSRNPHGDMPVLPG